MLEQKIRQYFLDHHIHSSQVAKDLGIDEAQLDAMLSGSLAISAEDYYLICQSLGVPLEYFFPAEDSAPPEREVGKP